MGSNVIDIKYKIHNYTETHKHMQTILNDKKLITKDDGNIKLTLDGGQAITREMKEIIEYSKDLKKQLSEIGKNSKLGESIQKELNLCETAITKLKKSVNEWGSEADKAAVKQLETYKKVEQKMDDIAKKEGIKKSVQQDIKELETLTEKYQDAYRKIEKSKNSLLNGKKLTPKELSYLTKTMEITEDKINRITKKLGKLRGKYKGSTEEINNALKHQEDAISFTKENAVQTNARDTLKALEGEWERLLDKKEKYSDSLGKDSKTVKEIDRQLDEITKEREKQKTILEQSLQKEVDAGRLTKETKNDILEQLAHQEKIAQNKRTIAETTRQETEKYNQVKTQLNEIFNIETRLTQLRKDPTKHSAEISYLEKLLAGKKDQYKIEEQITNLTPKQREEIEKIIQANKENNDRLKEQNKDWKRNQKSASELGDTIKKVFNYVIVYRFFYMLQEGIRKAIETMKDLDKAFTNIQMVTGDTDEQTAQLAKDYNDLAKSLGATTQEVAEGAAEWLRQGKNTEETTELLRSSMTLSKVGAMEASEATELLTSTLNGYKFAAKDAMTVVDQISSIDLAAATSSYELATALARTANSADDAGVKFEKLLAMIGTVSSVTRKSASTIRRII